MLLPGGPRTCFVRCDDRANVHAGPLPRCPCRSKRDQEPRRTSLVQPRGKVAIGLPGNHDTEYSLKGVSVEHGISGDEPGSRAPYIATAHPLFASVQSFQASFAPHAVEIMEDIPKYSRRPHGLRHCRRAHRCADQQCAVQRGHKRESAFPAKWRNSWDETRTRISENLHSWAL
jgi:hypothetical protein